MDTSYSGPYLSILASPALPSWPTEIHEWLRDRLEEIDNTAWQQIRARHGI